MAAILDSGIRAKRVNSEECENINHYFLLKTKMYTSSSLADGRNDARRDRVDFVQRDLDAICRELT